MKKWSVLLVLLGLLVISFPTLQAMYYDWQQNRVLDELEQLQTGLSQLNHTFERGIENDHSDQKRTATVKPSTTPGTLGMISIPVIDVRLPVLEGATQENMKFAAAHLVETAAIGQSGNAAIAAHRAHRKGRLFNRLGELQIGDSVEITLADQTAIHYKIDRISVVEPSDVSVLEDPGLGQVLTLITCDPLIDATHRLIIRAVKVNS
ncbi:sortase A [Paenibacillus sp. JGP012]|uniref:class D sortase n=1 Tax=Paenibacillus sp. JGP012 TaxID=2735914 RepID=UPI001838537E|nr:class D sortase [Paenibacillus sp. JGP012]MBB6021067.1 sortase A [Paenibacillus sp. JGP012]